MKRSTLVAVLGLSALLSAGVAPAQTGNDTNANTPPTSTPSATVPATDQASPQATTATEIANAKLAAIRERALATSEKDKKETEAKLDATKASVDKEAATKGDNVVAGRLATEFGMAADALIAEKAQYKTGWGNLMIAHALQANSSDVTVDQLFQMRTTDNLGWGQIANGLGLQLGDVVSAVKTEGKVATGLSKADGKVAHMHGASATHGASSSHAHGASGTGAGAGAGAAGTHGHSGK